MSLKDAFQQVTQTFVHQVCIMTLWYRQAILPKNLARTVFCFKRICPAGESIKNNINNYFGSRIEGFDSYRYYEGNDILRSWIAIPLTVGIFEKKTGTVEALFSPPFVEQRRLIDTSRNRYFLGQIYSLRSTRSV